jgi:hypothetical protein
VPPSAGGPPFGAMTTEPRRRRGVLRVAWGEVWGLVLEVVVVGVVVLVALALAALVLLVA